MDYPLFKSSIRDVLFNRGVAALMRLQPMALGVNHQCRHRLFRKVVSEKESEIEFTLQSKLVAANKGPWSL